MPGKQVLYLISRISKHFHVVLHTGLNMHIHTGSTAKGTFGACKLEQKKRGRPKTRCGGCKIVGYKYCKSDCKSICFGCTYRHFLKWSSNVWSSLDWSADWIVKLDPLYCLYMYVHLHTTCNQGYSRRLNYIRMYSVRVYGQFLESQFLFLKRKHF